MIFFFFLSKSLKDNYSGSGNKSSQNKTRKAAAKRKQVEINSGVSVLRKHELVLHCQSFLEVILYNTKAVVHFLLPDFFSYVCVCNIV